MVLHNSSSSSDDFSSNVNDSFSRTSVSFQESNQEEQVTDQSSESSRRSIRYLLSDISTDSDSEEEELQPFVAIRGRRVISTPISDQSDSYISYSDSDTPLPTLLSSSSSNSDEDENMSNSNASTENAAANSDSSDTEVYDVDTALNVDNADIVIEINDTQQPGTINDEGDDDDDDVILVPQQIETIDLCTQAVSIDVAPLPRRRLHNQVIEIVDSPTQPPPLALRAQFIVPRLGNDLGPTRNRRSVRNSTSPYSTNNNSNAGSSTRRRQQPQLNLDDSQGSSQQKIAINCPICLESVLDRTPVSTKCGHIFCQTCITAAINATKKCPICKKSVANNTIHKIFLGL